MTETIRTLVDIDLDGLADLSATSKEDPSTGHRTLKATTVCEGGFRNLTSVRDTAPVLVSEPCALLGDNAAPNPSEVVLAALGSCINVGLVANAGHRGIALTHAEIAMEGDIDISAVWGVGDTDPEKVMGFTAIRCSITLSGDADEATLAEIADNAMRWSPVVNTMTNKATVSHTTTVQA